MKLSELTEKVWKEYSKFYSFFLKNESPKFERIEIRVKPKNKIEKIRINGLKVLIDRMKGKENIYWDFYNKYFILPKYYIKKLKLKEKEIEKAKKLKKSFENVNISFDFIKKEMSSLFDTKISIDLEKNESTILTFNEKIKKILYNPSFKEKNPSFFIYGLIHELSHYLHDKFAEENKFYITYDYSSALREGIAILNTEFFIKELKLKELNKIHKFYLLFSKIRGYISYSFWNGNLLEEEAIQILNNFTNGKIELAKIRFLPGYKECYYPSYLEIKRKIKDINKLKNLMKRGFVPIKMALNF